VCHADSKEPRLRWIASPEPDTAAASLEKRLWSAADQFRANSGLKAQNTPAPFSD